MQKNTTKNLTISETHTHSNNKIFIKHVWWLDALLFIGGTILLGEIATLLGGKMFSFEGYQMPPATVPKIVFPFRLFAFYRILHQA